MKKELGRTLALLRHEKGMGQRAAAADLGISQSLLSHYENGVREPGLPFLIQACDYYNVSADFLLGRTLNRDGSRIVAEDLYDSSTAKDNRVRGTVSALLSRKLLSNSIGLLFEMLARTGSREAIAAASNYLSTAIYRCYRGLYRANPKNDPCFFSVPDDDIARGMPDLEMNCSEAEYQKALSNLKEEDWQTGLPELSHSMLQETFPMLCQSLFQLIHGSESRILDITRALNGARAKKKS